MRMVIRRVTNLPAKVEEVNERAAGAALSRELEGCIRHARLMQPASVLTFHPRVALTQVTSQPSPPFANCKLLLMRERVRARNSMLSTCLPARARALV